MITYEEDSNTEIFGGYLFEFTHSNVDTKGKQVVGAVLKAVRRSVVFKAVKRSAVTKAVYSDDHL